MNLYIPHLATRDMCCVSVQGLRPFKDPVFVVFDGESFRETLLSVSAVVKCDGLTLEHFLVWSPDVLPLRHDFCRPFSLFLSSFLGTQRILGYVRPRRKVAVHPTKRRTPLKGAFTGRCHIIGLQMLLRRMQTLN